MPAKVQLRSPKSASLSGKESNPARLPSAEHHDHQSGTTARHAAPDRRPALHVAWPRYLRALGIGIGLDPMDEPTCPSSTEASTEGEAETGDAYAARVRAKAAPQTAV